MLHETYGNGSNSCSKQQQQQALLLLLLLLLCNSCTRYTSHSHSLWTVECTEHPQLLVLSLTSTLRRNAANNNALGITRAGDRPRAKPPCAVPGMYVCTAVETLLASHT